MRWNIHQNKVERRRHHRQPVYQNPLFTKPNWQHFIIERLSFFGWMIVLIILVVVYILFYSPLFRITQVDIHGTQNISSSLIKEKYVDWQLQQKRLKIFPQNNMLTFSRKWLSELIGHNYSLASLTIDKHWPHTLAISFTEKTPELVWVTGGQYYYLGGNGDIASTLPSQDMAAGVPTIFDDSNTPISVGQNICGITSDQDKTLCREKVSFIKNLVGQMRQVTGVEVVSYHMLSGLSTQVNVLTKAGYSIYFDVTKDLPTQVAKLKRVLEDPATTAKPPREYIDVRLGDRVYYK